MADNSDRSIRANPCGDMPVVDDTAYIDPDARVIGKVVIGAGVYVGPFAVIRADETGADGEVWPVEIGAGCNVQDGAVIHALGGTSVTVGERTSLSHGCVVHGPCEIGAGCFVGFKAVVYNSTLGDGVFVNMGAVVQGVELGDDAFLPACTPVVCGEDVRRVVRETNAGDREFMQRVARVNVKLAEGYNRMSEGVDSVK